MTTHFQNRLTAYFFFYVTFYIYMFRAIIERQNFLDLILSICICSFAVNIVSKEFRFHNKDFPSNTKWLVFFTWPISFPIIIIYLKGLKGVLLFFLHTFLILVFPLIFDIYLLYYPIFPASS